MPDDRAASFLQMIRRSHRGRLKVYLGFAPGVGKTFQMLQEGHRLKAEGVDVVIGIVEDHGRAETRELINGLEQVPRRQTQFHGIIVEEMNLDSILARRPQVCLVDELAHTNAPDSRNAKRYQDVQDLLAAGIHVISTLNVQHLESLYNLVERMIGVKVRERIPDSVLAEADQVVNVDLTAEDLQQRLRAGKIYPKERIETSLENFFTAGNLEQLRELTLRELASQLDSRRRETRVADENGRPSAAADSATDQIMVCLSSRGPNSARLLRFGSRLAGRLNRNWYAVYVQTPREEPTVIDATTQRLVADTLTLANQLGATVFTFKGSDIAETILRFAKEYRVGQIVIGSPHPIPWWRRLLGERSVAEQLLMRQKDVTIVVVDAAAETPEAVGATSAAPSSSKVARSNESIDAGSPGVLLSNLTKGKVLLFTEPVTRRQVVEALVTAAAADAPELNTTEALSLIEKREAQGSTFLNEAVALPHARVPSLQKPVAALAVTQAGLLDAPTDKPVDVVFLLLTPENDANNHLKALAAAGRALQDRQLRRRLSTVRNIAEALDALETTRR